MHIASRDTARERASEDFYKRIKYYCSTGDWLYTLAQHGSESRFASISAASVTAALHTCTQTTVLQSLFTYSVPVLAMHVRCKTASGEGEIVWLRAKCYPCGRAYLGMGPAAVLLRP